MRPKQGMEPCQKKKYKLKETDKAAFDLSAEEWILQAASTKEREERVFVVDSGASMHMVSKRDLNSAELETARISKNPTTVMTANGEVQTREEATLYVKQLDLFVTVISLENTPAVHSLGKLCEHHGYSYHWTTGQKPHLTKMAIKSIAKKRITYQSLSLACRRVPLLHLHLLLQHLHRRILCQHGKSSNRKK